MFLRQGFFGATRDLLASRGGGPPKVQAVGFIESDPVSKLTFSVSRGFSADDEPLVSSVPGTTQPARDT